MMGSRFATLWVNARLMIVQLGISVHWLLRPRLAEQDLCGRLFLAFFVLVYIHSPSQTLSSISAIQLK